MFSSSFALRHPTRSLFLCRVFFHILCCVVPRCVGCLSFLERPLAFRGAVPARSPRCPLGGISRSTGTCPLVCVPVSSLRAFRYFESFIVAQLLVRDGHKPSLNALCNLVASTRIALDTHVCCLQTLVSSRSRRVRPSCVFVSCEQRGILASRHVQTLLRTLAFFAGSFGPSVTAGPQPLAAASTRSDRWGPPLPRSLALQAMSKAGTSLQPVSSTVTTPAAAPSRTVADAINTIPVFSDKLESALKEIMHDQQHDPFFRSNFDPIVYLNEKVRCSASSTPTPGCHMLPCSHLLAQRCWTDTCGSLHPSHSSFARRLLRDVSRPRSSAPAPTPPPPPPPRSSRTKSRWAEAPWTRC